MDEYGRILALQQQLETGTGGKTRACLLNGLSKRADKVKSDFKVPDKRFVFRAIVVADHSIWLN